MKINTRIIGDKQKAIDLRNKRKQLEQLKKTLLKKEDATNEELFIFMLEKIDVIDKIVSFLEKWGFRI